MLTKDFFFFLKVSRLFSSTIQINKIAAETSTSYKVVIHALIVHNGNLEKARQYLLGEAEQGWSVEEDDLIRYANPDNVEQHIATLLKSKSKSDILKRCQWLKKN